MTGKEMLVVLGGAAVLGGGAGTAAVMLAPAPVAAPAPAAVTDARLTARLEEMEKEVRATRAALDESRNSARMMQEKLDELAKRPAMPTFRTSDPAHPGSTSSMESGDGEMQWSHSLDGLQMDTKNIEGELTELLAKMGDLKDGEGPMVLRLADGVTMESSFPTADGESRVMSLALDGLSSGLRLRMLPEEERWKKAQDELGLGAGQVQAIKDAAAERDRAMEDAMVTEKRSIGTDGGEVTVRRLDPVRASEANKVYRDRVNGNLTAEQQKTWKEKGYDHAFGKTGMGGGSVMAMTFRAEQTLSRDTDSTTKEVEDEKSGE